MTAIVIRPEQPTDYAAIAAVHVRAFENRASEALIVALHRHRAAFDPDLSLVAEEDGQVVGHVLFSPRDKTSRPSADQAKLRVTTFPVNEVSRTPGRPSIG